MIKKILVIVCLVFSIQAQAEPVDCKGISELAETMMQLRQTGVPMSRVHDLITKDFDPVLQEIATTMLQLAYEKPRYSSVEYKKRAITDFGSEWFLQCLKAKGKEV